MAWLIWCVSRNTQKYILNWILFTIHIHSTYLSVKTCIPHHFTEFAIVFEFQLTESYSYVNLNKHQYLRIYVTSSSHTWEEQLGYSHDCKDCENADDLGEREYGQCGCQDFSALLPVVVLTSLSGCTQWLHKIIWEKIIIAKLWWQQAMRFHQLCFDWPSYLYILVQGLIF